MDNIWEKIPLEDYEKHMSHETVGQLQLLSELTKKYLTRLKPETSIFLGVSGGNGLEHIDNKITKKVYGIDINNEYLRQTGIRFANSIKNLDLINLDISDCAGEIEKVDFIWAALIFEYVEMNSCFKFISNNIQDNGYVIISIQVNNGAGSISKSGVETVKLIGQIFKSVDPTDLQSFASKFNFIEIGSEENFLPNGKSIKTFCFRKSGDL